MHFLVVKKGALGDVVRTSYFAEALKRKFGSELRLSWITAPASADLLRLNPHIDDLWFDFEQAKPFRLDRIFSLDDELDTLYQKGASYTDAVHPAVIAKELTDFMYRGKLPKEQTTFVSGGIVRPRNSTVPVRGRG